MEAPLSGRPASPAEAEAVILDTQKGMTAPPTVFPANATASARDRAGSEAAVGRSRSFLLALLDHAVELKTLFVARNQISHEVDLRAPERQGERARRARAIRPTVQLCHEGLEVAQLIINAVGNSLAAEAA